MRLLSRFNQKIVSRRFVILLQALIIFLLLSPLSGEADSRGFSLILLSTLFALATIYAASTRRSHLIIGVLLALLWSALAWPSSVSASSGVRVAADVAFVVLSFFALWIAFERVFMSEDETVDFNTICGAIAIYLVLGITWATSYRVIETLVPGSFSFASGSGEPAWPELLYYSYTTLTTLGYGEIVPKTSFARIWAITEAITGVLYTAILVARLVSLYRHRS